MLSTRTKNSEVASSRCRRGRKVILMREILMWKFKAQKLHARVNEMSRMMIGTTFDGKPGERRREIFLGLRAARFRES